jgi:hypothetical protein
MRPGEPRRWLLITREAGIPDAEGGQARWFLDHLFIDQDAIPTLVEVKRSSDTRLRREVVGQMLDYAANVVAYWPGAELRRLFDDRSRTGSTCCSMGTPSLGRNEKDDDARRSIDRDVGASCLGLCIRPL